MDKETFVKSLKSRLELDETTEDKVLDALIDTCVYDVLSCRFPYKTDVEYTIDKVENRLIPILTRLCVYDYNKVGVEGQASHSENGVSRLYNKRTDILDEIVPFCGGL